MKTTYVLSTLFAGTLVAGCLGSDAPSEPPLARFVASERSIADLGVTAWEVFADGEDVRVIGYGNDSARRAEAIVRRDAATADERVRIEGVFPERGEVELTNAGAVEGTDSDALRTLAVDLNADLGKGATPVAAPVEADDGLGVASSELGLGPDQSGIYFMGWNLWGYCHTPVVGNSCRTNHIRHHAEIFAEGGSPSSWSPSDWVLPVATHCQTRITTCVGAGRWDNFHWSVWSEKINVALGKPAFQSSTDHGGVAQRAVDGLTYGQYNGFPQLGLPPSTTHTLTQFQPFWQVDLGGVQNLARVVLFNRTDCCTERLADVDILYSVDGINFTVATQTFGPMSTASAELIANGMARFVRVQLRGTGILSLAEVQVYGS